MRFSAVLLGLVLIGCGDSGSGGDAGEGGGSAGRGGSGGGGGAGAPAGSGVAGQGGGGGAAGQGGTGMATPPRAPAQDDPRFTVETSRTWLALGDGLTEAQNQLTVRVTAPAGAGAMHAWIGMDGPFPLSGGAVTLDVSMLPAGRHVVLLAEAGAAEAFAAVEVHRTHLLYTVVSVDWEDGNMADDAIARMVALKEAHPRARLTQFVGPYTYTDPSVPADRQQGLTEFILRLRDQGGDEIGVHIHPWCHFITSTGVTCRSQPSTVYPTGGDTTGYTVRVNGYTEDEAATFFMAAAQKFMDKGLGRPTSFRAGGWTADLSTLRALGRAGFTVDTSANNWRRMEEWMSPFPPGANLYQWNMTNWASIGDTSQPYYPSESDLLGAAPPTVAVLEVPDNGILVDYVTEQEMIEVMNANLALHAVPGYAAPALPALSAPTLYQIGFHQTIGVEDHRRMDVALDAVDAGLYDEDRGPIVYARISDLTRVWQR